MQFLEHRIKVMWNIILNSLVSHGWSCGDSYTMLRIGVLFISKTLPYSFCACVRNTPKIVSFVFRKMKLVSFSSFHSLKTDRAGPISRQILALLEHILFTLKEKGT